MNKRQKILNAGVRTNIKLYPLEKSDSFYKRRKLLKEAMKLLDKGVFDVEDLD